MTHSGYGGAGRKRMNEQRHRPVAARRYLGLVWFEPYSPDSRAVGLLSKPVLVTGCLRVPPVKAVCLNHPTD